MCQQMIATIDDRAEVPFPAPEVPALVPLSAAALGARRRAAAARVALVAALAAAAQLREVYADADYAARVAECEARGIHPPSREVWSIPTGFDLGLADAEATDLLGHISRSRP